MGFDPVSYIMGKTAGGGGGGGANYPFWHDVYNTETLPTRVTVNATITAPLAMPSWVHSASQNTQKFVNGHCRLSSRGSARSDVPSTASITEKTAQMSLSQALSDGSAIGTLIEYYGNLYNNNILETYNMTLLGDFSQTGEPSGNMLSDTITHYSAIALQGIYQSSRESVYSTTIIYYPELNEPLWTGMKDRNPSYDCIVTFTDAQTVSLSGKCQVMIYGIP